MKIKVFMLVVISILLNLSISNASQQSIKWMESAEYNAICYQTYNCALDKFNKYLSESPYKKFIIISDIDDTILSTIQFNKEMILKGLVFNQEDWGNWINNNLPEPISGSLKFFEEVSSKGAEIFYVTNRHQIYKEKTIHDMVLLGFPNADSDHVFFRSNTYDKTVIRNKIKRESDIVIYIGDKLSDFSNIFYSLEERKQLVDNKNNLFGSVYFILPNPSYGDWLR